MTSLRSGPTKIEVALARRGKSAAIGRERRGRDHLAETSEVMLLRVGREAPGVVARVLTWLGEWLGVGEGERDVEEEEGLERDEPGPLLLVGLWRDREGVVEEEEEVLVVVVVVLVEEEEEEGTEEDATDGEGVASGALLFSALECRMSLDFSASEEKQHPIRVIEDEISSKDQAPSTNKQTMNKTS